MKNYGRERSNSYRQFNILCYTQRPVLCTKRSLIFNTSFMVWVYIYFILACFVLFSYPSFSDFATFCDLWELLVEYMISKLSQQTIGVFFGGGGGGGSHEKATQG